MIVDKYEMRKHNKKITIENIIKNGSISRADLSNHTTLNKSTISDIVKEFLDDGFVLEVGEGESTDVGGRKPILIELNKKVGISVAFDIGVDYIKYSANFLNGEIIYENSRRKINISKNTIIDQIDEIIAEIKEKLRKLNINARYGIIGLGIAIHGISTANKIMFTPYYDLDEINLYGELSKKYPFPINIENEANLTAIAEITFSSKYSNIVSLSIYSGIGAGIIINGELLSGKNGIAGEIGHTIIVPNGKPCPCGNKGCLEQYCSEKALIREYEKILGEYYNDDVSMEMIKNDYKNKNPDVIKIIDEYAFYFSIAINNVLASYNPQIIFLSSDLFYEFPELFDKIKSQISKLFNASIHLENSKLGMRSRLFGATAVNVKSFLDIDQLTFFDNIFEVV